MSDFLQVHSNFLFCTWRNTSMDGPRQTHGLAQNRAKYMYLTQIRLRPRLEASELEID